MAGSDTASLPAPDGLWPGWEQAIERFSEATKLVVSVYDPQGQRRLGPLVQTRLGELLAQSTLWHAGGEAERLERQLASQASAQGAVAVRHGQMHVHAAPLWLFGEPRGAVVYGWALADYANGLDCERLARESGLPGRKLWSVARLETPISDRRMATYGALLRTIIDSSIRLREALAQVEAVSQARDVLLANVSHDLRTPLSSIALRISLLLMRTDLPGDVHATLEAAQRSVKEEARLIDDLLLAAVTRTGQFSLQPAAADLRAIVSLAVEEVRPFAESRRVSLTLEAGAQTLRLPLLADEQRLQQALWNVISNAVKFTPKDGRVHIAVYPDAASYVVDIADTGPGIAPELLPRIFEPFVRSTAANRTGFGLGLTIARQVVELHKGELSVASPAGLYGTKFTIRLPRSSESGAEKASSDGEGRGR